MSIGIANKTDDGFPILEALDSSSGQVAPLTSTNVGGHQAIDVNIVAGSGGGGGGGGAITAADGAVVTIGSKADTLATDSISSWSLVALLKGVYAKLAGTLATSSADGAIVSIGSKADALATDSVSSWSLVSLLKGVYARLVSGIALVIGGSALSATNPVPVLDGYQNPVTASWNAATAVNTPFAVATAGYDTVILTFVPSGPITGGAIIFEVFDGATWLPVKAPRIESYATEGSYVLTGGSRAWQVPVAGFPQFRVRLTTAITGAGTVGLTIITSSAPDTSLVTVGIDPATYPLPIASSGTTFTTPPGSFATGTNWTGANGLPQNISAIYIGIAPGGYCSLKMDVGGATVTLPYVQGGWLPIPRGSNITQIYSATQGSTGVVISAVVS